MTEAQPYCDGLLMAVLRPALGADVDVRTEEPADPVGGLPYLVAHAVPGGATPDPRFAFTSYLVQLDGYATEKRAAHDLAAQAIAALVEAWRSNSPTPDGRICLVKVQQPPALLRLPGFPSGVSRYTAAVTVAIRP